MLANLGRNAFLDKKTMKNAPTIAIISIILYTPAADVLNDAISQL